MDTARVGRAGVGPRSEEVHAEAIDYSAVSLVRRGDRVVVRNVVASAWNRTRKHLLVASAPMLYLYGYLLELGGELLRVLAAEENTQFQFVLCLPWLDAYSVIAQVGDGSLEHRVVNGELTVSWITHRIMGHGSLNTAIANPARKELITADSDGGFKVWVLRVSMHPGNGLSTGCKGFLRIHAGNRKYQYFHLFLCCGGDILLACSATRIHAFDTTTFARIGTLFKDPSRVIIHATWDAVANAIFLRFKNRKRDIFKFSLIQARGHHTLQFSGQYQHNSEISVIASNSAMLTEQHQRQESSQATAQHFDGVFIIDDCGHLGIGQCQEEAVPSPNIGRLDFRLHAELNASPTVDLHYSPLVERYSVMYAEMSAACRNYVIIASTSGISLVEVFLPNSESRYVTTNVPGTHLAALQTVDWNRISIYNSDPPSLLLLGPGHAEFCPLLLQSPDAYETNASVKNRAVKVALTDHCAIPGGIILAWSNGIVEQFLFQQERTFPIGRVDGSKSVVATFSMAPRWQLIVAGDEMGRVAMWSVDGENCQEITRREIHNGRIASLVDTSERDISAIRDAMTLLSLSGDGEVKMWYVSQHESTSNPIGFGWELLVCFHTYGSDISASTFMAPEYLFCGFEEGAFECWRLPSPASLKGCRHDRGQHSLSRRIAVRKKALHTVDIHLSRIRQIIVELNDAGKIMTEAPPHLDEFAWVITYDADHLVLVWCFNTAFLFPHRRLQPHIGINGGFVTMTPRYVSYETVSFDIPFNELFHGDVLRGPITNATYDTVITSALGVFAYLGRCIERIDNLTAQDKQAAKDRVRRGREKTEARAKQEEERKQTNSADSIDLSTIGPETDRRSNSFKSPRRGIPLRFGAPEDSNVAVRIRIKLPTVDQTEAIADVEQARNPSPLSFKGGSSHRHRSPPKPTKHGEGQVCHSPTSLVKTDDELSRHLTSSSRKITEHNDGIDSTSKRSAKENRLLVASANSTTTSMPSVLTSATNPTEIAEVFDLNDQLPVKSTDLDANSFKFTSNNMKPNTSPSTAVVNKSRNARSRQHVDRPETSYVPESVPSQFQKAKPRVYSNLSLRPSTNQVRCAVISSAALGLDAKQEATVTPEIGDCDYLSIPDGSSPELVLNDKLAIVSLTDDAHAMLRLDFRDSDVKKKQATSATNINDNKPQASLSGLNLTYIPWAALNSDHQLAELMVAARSRFVYEEARHDGIRIPTAGEFASTEIKTQVMVRSFSRWFLATQKSHQRIREGFLNEELICAAKDPYVLAEIKQSGGIVPPIECIGILDAKSWREFLLWYASGKLNSPLNPALPNGAASTASKDRIDARATFLRRRLQITDAAATDTDELLFVFDELSALSESQLAASTPMAWSSLSLISQQKELALALLDPHVQRAAMADEIELPDLAVVGLDNFDIFSVAGKFVSWWKAPTNVNRHSFLEREISEAQFDDVVISILENEKKAAEEDENPDVTVPPVAFEDEYFRSPHARLSFMKKKLFYLKRKNRIVSVAESSKLPAPIMFESTVVPLCLNFHFPDAALPPVIMETVEEQEVFDGETIESDETVIDTAPEPSDFSLGQDDEQLLQLELGLMAMEDTLSRAVNNHANESDSEEEQEPDTRFAAPKRSDFTRSYFFGNLTAKTPGGSSGWVAGSGIDNGDEEIEEEERLDREREQQELLDRQEAERIAEAERQAERLKIEKERAEKAHQTRRIRHAELKKVLVRQAQLVLQRERKREAEDARAKENAATEARLLKERRRVILERERSGMLEEDQQSRLVEKSIRDFRVSTMRRMLHELTLMDAEDTRSAKLQAAQLEVERQREHRTKELEALYEPFEPYFVTSRSPSEKLLPVIVPGSLEHNRRRLALRHPKDRYTISHSEALELDEVEHDVYIARESRKMRLLLSLPTRTPTGRKATRIPSEREILNSRQKQRLQIVDNNNSLDEEDRDLRPRTAEINSMRGLSETRQDKKRHPPLPELLKRKPRGGSWTDLNAAMYSQHPNTVRTPKKKTQTSVSQNRRDETVLPFFRGNFGVRGESKSRANEYVSQ